MNKIIVLNFAALPTFGTIDMIHLPALQVQHADGDLNLELSVDGYELREEANAKVHIFTMKDQLWSYSPNLDGGWTTERFLQRYPGNDRVTLIGEDAYQWGTEEEFVEAVNSDLTFLTQFAKDNGKLLAMTECGLKNIPDSTWFSRVLKVQMDKYPISYFLLWRNAETEHFGPVPNTPCGDDYSKAFKEAENVMFLEDIKD